MNREEYSLITPEASDVNGNPERAINKADFAAALQPFLYQTFSSTSIADRSKDMTRSEATFVKPSAPKVKSETRTFSTPTPRSRKRKSLKEDTTTPSIPSSSKRRSTTKERSAKDPYNPENKLVDSLRPGLMLVFIGLNPGLKTAELGHAYAHPSNSFWPLLHQSGITPIRHKPEHTHGLMDLYNIGNTNLCTRATRAGDGLSKEEQVDGAKVVEGKISELKPEAVCIVGKGVWEFCYKMKTGRNLKKGTFSYGWQPENLWLGRKVDKEGQAIWQGSRTFVSTSTSGLAADTKPAEKLAIMKELGDWVNARRAENDQEVQEFQHVDAVKVEEENRG